MLLLYSFSDVVGEEEKPPDDFPIEGSEDDTEVNEGGVVIVDDSNENDGKTANESAEEMSVDSDDERTDEYDDDVEMVNEESGLTADEESGDSNENSHVLGKNVNESADDVGIDKEGVDEKNEVIEIDDDAFEENSGKFALVCAQMDEEIKNTYDVLNGPSSVEDLSHKFITLSETFKGTENKASRYAVLGLSSAEDISYETFINLRYGALQYGKYFIPKLLKICNCKLTYDVDNITDIDDVFMHEIQILLKLQEFKAWHNFQLTKVFVNVIMSSMCPDDLKSISDKPKRLLTCNKKAKDGLGLDVVLFRLRVVHRKWKELKAKKEKEKIQKMKVGT